MAFCEEKVECRRVILMAHFGETSFTAASCGGTCDTCRENAGQEFEQKDMTAHATRIARLVEELSRFGGGGSARGGRSARGGGGQDKNTAAHIRDVYHGANTAAVRKKGHDTAELHGAGKDLRWGLGDSLAA